MSVRDKGLSDMRGWGGGHQLDQWKHTPSYEKDIKEIGNKSMETTKTLLVRLGGWKGHSLVCSHSRKNMFKLWFIVKSIDRARFILF